MTDDQGSSRVEEAILRELEQNADVQEAKRTVIDRAQLLAGEYGLENLLSSVDFLIRVSADSALAHLQQSREEIKRRETSREAG